jgi:hypothetical protein
MLYRICCLCELLRQTPRRRRARLTRSIPAL